MTAITSNAQWRLKEHRRHDKTDHDWAAYREITAADFRGARSARDCAATDYATTTGTSTAAVVNPMRTWTLIAGTLGVLALLAMHWLDWPRK